MDDGPGESPPEGLLDTPDAEPRIEPILPRANRPYTVFGKTYTPVTDDAPFKQRGIGSWYGKKFHGQKTSSGELYDMYKMTAAHPTLPIPSYARVTNLSNGKQVIVRVNDRGPFHSGRIIDLSYTAALKLGYLGKGSGMLEVERLLPDEIERIAAARKAEQEQPVATQEGPPAVAEATSLSPESTVDVLAVALSEGRIEPSPLPDSATAQPVVVPVPGEGSLPGFYLQLGAYSRPENADAVRSRLQQTSAPAVAPVQVVKYGMFYRLYSGPFASRADASAAAKRLQESGVATPLIVQR